MCVRVCVVIVVVAAAAVCVARAYPPIFLRSTHGTCAAHDNNKNINKAVRSACVAHRVALTRVSVCMAQFMEHNIHFLCASVDAQCAPEGIASVERNVQPHMLTQTHTHKNRTNNQQFIYYYSSAEWRGADVWTCVRKGTRGTNVRL